MSVLVSRWKKALLGRRVQAECGSEVAVEYGLVDDIGCSFKSLYAALYKNKLLVAAIYAKNVSIPSKLFHRNTHSNGILSGVPASVQDLLVKVQRVDLHRVPKSPRTGCAVLDTIFGWSRAADLLGFEGRFVRLQDDIGQRV